MIGSEIAPVTIDQYTGDVRHNLRQNDDLHVYYAFQKDFRHEPNAQGNTVPGFGDNRGGHRQVLTVNETHVFSQALVNEVRGGYNRISISFDPRPKVDTNALGINLGQTTMPVALPQITISGPGLNFGGPGGFPSAREVTTTRVRRHGDLPARQPHHQVRRRVPPTSSTTATTAIPAPSRIRAWRRSSRDSAAR